jgi:ABC-2 type transport system permease protein
MVAIIILYLGFVMCGKAIFNAPDMMLGSGLSFLVFSTITGIQMPLFFKMGYTKAKLWSLIPFAVVMLLVVLPSFVSALSGVLDFAQSHKELFAFACILTSCIIQFVSYHIAVIFYRKQR